MKIKKGANISGLRPEILLAVMVANDIITTETRGGDKVFHSPLVITECTGGKHGNGSLHYVGLAVDIRKRDFSPFETNELIALLKARLSAQYDVVNEKTHIHIEFQPK